MAEYSEYKKIDIQLIEPPGRLVDFAYWILAATGVTLAPLLKIWNCLAKKHKLLPYFVLLFSDVFLVFTIWLIQRWICFQTAHLSF